MTSRTYPAIVAAFAVLVSIGLAGAVTPTAAVAVDSNDTRRSPNVSEPAVQFPVPEDGDPYFEAAARDGRWVSYINPRDEYQSPYRGEGSGKICVSLRNERGEVVVGESVPNTTVTVPTGDAIAWHSEADPMRVQFPLSDHYDRPLDADQFGTSPDLPQGDGYLDAHCIEFHGLSVNSSVEYGEAEITGEHADRIDVVGYVQQAHRAWNTSVDPITDAESHEAAGGGWTYEPAASHGQVVVVLQLDPPATTTPAGTASPSSRVPTETPGATDRPSDGAGTAPWTVPTGEKSVTIEPLTEASPPRRTAVRVLYGQTSTLRFLVLATAFVALSLAIASRLHR